MRAPENNRGNKAMTKDEARKIAKEKTATVPKERVQEVGYEKAYAEFFAEAYADAFGEVFGSDEYDEGYEIALAELRQKKSGH